MKYKRCITTTTRKPRIGEENGLDYHFVSMEEFENKIKEQQFVENVKFANNRYGLTTNEIPKTDNEKCLLIVEHNGFSNIKEYAKENPWLKFQTVFLDIEKNQLKENMLERGDTLEEVEERMSKDNISEEFNKLIKEKKYTDNILIIKDLMKLEELKIKVENFLEEDTKMLLIIGPSGSGKDTLQQYLIDNV